MFVNRILFLNYKKEYQPLHKIYRGGLLFTKPEENTLAIKRDYETQNLLQEEKSDKNEPTLNLRNRMRKVKPYKHKMIWFSG